MVLGFSLIMLERGHTYDEESIEFHKNLQKQHPCKYFFVFFVGPLIFLSYFVMLNIEPYTKSLTGSEKSMLGSKIGMGTYGAPFFLCLWVTVVVVIFIIYNTISTQYRISKIKGNNG